MAVSKLNFWIGVVFLFSIIVSGMVLVGNALVGEISLTADSLSYIDLMDGEAGNTKVSELSNTNATESKQVSYITGDNETGNVVGTDNIGVLFYFKEIGSQLENIFKIALNSPSTFVIGLGLPLNNFRSYINIISLLGGIGLTLALIRGILK